MKTPNKISGLALAAISGLLIVPVSFAAPTVIPHTATLNNVVYTFDTIKTGSGSNATRHWTTIGLRDADTAPNPVYGVKSCLDLTVRGLRCTDAEWMDWNCGIGVPSKYSLGKNPSGDGVAFLLNGVVVKPECKAF
jgi:hypothetical protein